MPDKSTDVSRVIPNIAGIMKEWEYTFDPVSREDWIKQIETDLRQKPASSLQAEWWPGEPLIPLIHHVDLQGDPIRLPDHFFKHPPLVSEFIHTTGKSVVDVNQKIHEALQQGAQSIILWTDLSEGNVDPDWFKDVMQDLVSLSIQPDNLDKIHIHHFSKTTQDELLFRIQRNEQPIPINIILEEFLSNKKTLDTVRFVYHFPSSGNWITQTTDLLNSFLKDLEEWTSNDLSPETFFNQCILSLQADPSYFKHIIQTRVLHVLWQNIRDHQGLDSKGSDENYLECHIEQGENENPDRFLIRASMSALAASLSGTHALCIHHAELADIKPFYSRINRNIHHLLNLESGMYKGTDPLSGSYALDFHARNWTRKIWDMLSL